MSQLLRHFGFTSNPFARTPGPDALCRHRGFEEAHGRLALTIEMQGIAVLLAEAGCGKSLLLGVLADTLGKEGWAVHYFAHSTVGPFGLVNVLARKVGLAPRRSRAETAAVVAQQLIEDGRRHLLVVDEAHQLPDPTLDDLRLLTIADFDRKSPFLLLLAGLPSLDDRLGEPTHHALDQRVTTIARLPPLSIEETRSYVGIRLAAVGARDRPVFEDGAIDAVFDAAAGVPRRINNIATSALIVAAARHRRVVSTQDVLDARLDRGRP